MTIFCFINVTSITHSLGFVVSFCFTYSSSYTICIIILNLIIIEPRLWLFRSIFIALPTTLDLLDSNTSHIYGIYHILTIAAFFPNLYNLCFRKLWWHTAYWRNQGAYCCHSYKSWAPRIRNSSIVIVWESIRLQSS